MALRDGKKVTDMDMGFIEKFLLKKGLKAVAHTDIIKLLETYELI